MARNTSRSLKNWAERRRVREEGFEITLPSGPTVRLRGVDLGYFLLTADFKDMLTGIVDDMVAAYEGRLTDERAKEINSDTSMESRRDQYKVWLAYAKAALVHPKLVDEPVTDDEIGEQDLSPVDLRFIFMTGVRPLEDLARFRQKQKVDVDGVQPEPGVSHPAEPSADDAGVD